MRETIDKVRTFALLRQKGVLGARVEFYGGNDEGGAERITLLAPNADPSGEPLEVDLDIYYGGWREPKQELTLDEELSDLLCAPVYSEYGSFAGEFSVSGTVTWDVAGETCVMHQDYREYDSGWDY